MGITGDSIFCTSGSASGTGLDAFGLPLGSENLRDSRVTVDVVGVG